MGEKGGNDLLLQNGKDNKVFQRDGVEIALIRDGKRGSLRHALVLHVHVSPILNAAFPYAAAIPVFRVVATIGPLRGILATVGQVCKRLVVTQLDGEGAAGGDVEEDTLWRRGGVAASVVLEPPLLLRQVVQRIHWRVAVEVGVRRVCAVLLLGKRVKIISIVVHYI